MRHMILLAAILVAPLNAQPGQQDWRLVGGGSGEKIYANFSPKSVMPMGKKAVSVQLMSSSECSMFAITTHYLRFSTNHWEIAFKSQIEYNWDATIRFENVKPDSGLEWANFEFTNNELDQARLGRARILLDIPKEPVTP